MYEVRIWEEWRAVGAGMSEELWGEKGYLLSTSKESMLFARWKQSSMSAAKSSQPLNVMMWFQELSGIKRMINETRMKRRALLVTAFR